jgi:TonB-linked SusC/RagA family outer membrane protein
MFKNSGYTYKIVNNQIIVSKANAVAAVEKQQQQQAKKVTGCVKDALGEPIIGASVVEKGAPTNGTITDFDGNFTLTVSGNELQISYIGYLPQVVKVQSGVTSYNVTLKEDTKTLDEVVVIGYGTQKKVNLTGAVASVSTDDIKDRVQTNVLSAIQGTVPGVTIISRPGSTPSINFRGRGNLGTSAPLYVIDGAIADATVFSNLDPNTIESISFLKDAASSAIYGSRAAYGVVLVTTKGGKAEKMNVAYSGYVGVKTPTYLPDVLDSWDYATLLNEAKYNANPSGGKNQAYTNEEIGWFRDGSNPDYYPNTNWADLVLDKHVLTTQHSLNFSGGSEKVRFFSSVGYVFNDNFMPGVTDDRYNLNLNLQSDVTKWLTLKTGVKYIRNSSDTKNGTPWIANFVLVPSIMVAQQSNGEWGSIAGGKDATQTFMNSNPLRTLSFDNWSKSTTENTMYGFDLKPIENLVISGQLDYKRYEYKSKSYSAEYPEVVHFETGKEIPGTGNSSPNSMSMYWISNSNMMTTLTAKYDLKLGQHAVNFLVGTSYEHYKSERLYSKRTDFVSDGLEDIEQGNNISKDLPDGRGIVESKMLSYFGRINYSYKDRYLFEANLRADASSRFHKDNRWGWFPSFSAGWRISEESFMKPIAWLNNLKLRASYGTLGNINNVGYYDYFELLSSNANYNFNDEPVKGVLEAQITNKTLGWETVALADFGLDVDLFDNKLSVTADYYIKNTKDILLGYNVPAETGIWTKPVMNLAKVRNTGFELAVTYRNKIGDLSYSVSGNIATNNNEIVTLAGSDNMIQNGGDVVRYILKEGEAIGSYYGLETDGLYTQEEIDAGHYYKYGRKPNAGDIKYVPQRENVEWGDDITDDDRTIIGKDVPDFTYGININLQWKNFELSAFGQGVSGTSVAFESEQVFAFMLNSNPRKYHLSRWNEDNPNPNAACPRLYGGNYYDEYNKHFSDYQLFDADYFRIKTISLGYMVPKDAVTRWGLSSLKFFLTGENLFTFRADKDMKDFDPESSTGRGISAFGAKSVAFGVNVSF